MKFRILSEAEQDALEAATWYEIQQPGLGTRFHEALGNRMDDIAENPLRFARLETVRTSVNVRRAQLARFPYRVIFKLAPSEIVIIAVVHAKRRPGYWMSRLE